MLTECCFRAIKLRLSTSAIVPLPQDITSDRGEAFMTDERVYFPVKPSSLAGLPVAETRRVGVKSKLMCL